MKRLLIALGLVGAAVPAGAMIFEGGPDEAIFGRQHLPIYFNHDYHVRAPDEAKGIEGEGLECDFCHENTPESTTSVDRDIPGHDNCETCHDEWIGDEDEPAPPAECARCHKDFAAGQPGPPQPLFIPEPNLKFPHKTHIEAGAACTDCHGDVPNKTVATRDDYPTMDRCIECHEAQQASTECRTCHLTASSGRLVTHLARGEQLMPRRYHISAVHDADFLRDHAVPAKRDKAYCANCHAESDCLECHDGVGRDVRYHPGDWISSHGVRAKMDDFRCQSCHRLQKFCTDCHLRSGVATFVTLNNLAPERRTVRVDESGLRAVGPHPMEPDGWLSPGSRNFHGFHAQRNIRSCASCHQEQYCLTCHKSAFGTGLTTSLGGNPHGPNPERLKGSALRKGNARMCLKCHSPLDPAWR